MSDPKLSYDAATKKGVITFPNGHRLTIANVDEAKAKQFFEKNAAEFAKRDCVLHTSACVETRSASHE